MSARVLSLRALPVTFLVYVLEAALAVFASWPNGASLVERLPELSLDPAALKTLAALAQGLARAHGLALAALLLLAPWLHMSWLAMLSEPQSPLRALATGARSVTRAVRVSLTVGLAFLLAAAPFVALAWGTLHWLGESSDARRHDLILAVLLAPLLPLAFYFQIVHDLARAAALAPQARRRVRRGLAIALRPETWLAAAGAALAGVALPAAAHASAWQLSALPATMLLQSVLFVRLVVRAAWLGHALALVRPAPEPSTGKYDE